MHSLEQLNAKYELGETLGTGAFSEVKVAIERATGNKYAIKIVDKAKCRGKESMIETEVNILMRVRHENIVQLYEMYEIDARIYLVMELVTGGELFDEIVKIGKFTEADAARIVHRILLAIEYLHSQGIAHRDLKPENLLLSDRSPQAKVMISDFGLSKIFNDNEVMRTACGTPGYVAPEVLRRQGYGREIDLWSLGVITYILLCGYPPFYDQNNVELFRQIMAGRFEFDRPWWDNISETAKDFIRKLLVLDPRERSPARVALAHPFITNNCGPAPTQSDAADASTQPTARTRVAAPQSQNIPQPFHGVQVSAAPPVVTNGVEARPSSTSSTSSGRPSGNRSSSESRSAHQQQQKGNAQPQQQQQNQHLRPDWDNANYQNSLRSSAASTGSTNGGFRTSPDDTSPPGVPLGNKSQLDDSGCITSHESIGRRTRWSWKPVKWGW